MRVQRRRQRRSMVLETLESRCLLASGVTQVAGGSQISALYQSGFNPTGLYLNGDATLSGSTLRLTNGGVNQTSSAFHMVPIDVTRNFTTSFQFQLSAVGTDPMGGGFTFDIQNMGNVVNATGSNSTAPDSLGLTQGKHLAIAFNTFNDNIYNWPGNEFSDNSTGLYLDQNVPRMGDTSEIVLPKSVIDLHSGHTFQATIQYVAPTTSASGSIIETLVDTVTGGTWSYTYSNIDIQSMLQLNDVSGQYAYAGFTASTGSPMVAPTTSPPVTSVQDIKNWTWQDGTELATEAYSATFTLNSSQMTSGAVFDANGNVVRTLWQATTLPAGTYPIYWNGTNQYGTPVDSTVNPGPYTFQVVLNSTIYSDRRIIANTSNNPTNPVSSISALGMFGVAVSPDGSKIWAVGLAGDTAGGGFIKQFDANGNVNVQATTPMGNYHIGTAVAVDSGYLYVSVQLWNYSGKHGIIRINLANYDQATGFTDYGHVNPDGSQNTSFGNWNYLQVVSGLPVNQFANVLTGIAVSNYGDPNQGLMYVSDLTNNCIHVYNKVTGDQVGSPILVNHPTGVAVDASGNLWVAHGTGSSANQISVYDASGQLLRDVTEATGLKDIVSLSIVNGALYVADNGAGHVLVYTISGTGLSNGASPQTVGAPATYGVDNGKNYFWDLRGAAADANGNIFTVQRTIGASSSGELGSQLEKWSSGGSPVWVQGGYEYYSSGGAYLPSDPTIMYSTSLHRYKVLDPAAGTWQYIGSAAYPGMTSNPWSGLFTSAPSSPMKFVQIGGTQFLTIVTSENRVIFYRINPDGSVHPASIVGTQGLANGHAWTWTDTLGDGVPQNSQIQDAGVAVGVARLTVDSKGNLWYVSTPNWNQICEIPLQGVDANGNPVYNWNNPVTIATLPSPQTIVVGDDGIYAQVYDPGIGPLSSGSFTGGYSIGGANALVKFDFTGKRLWTIPLPDYSISMAPIPGGGVMVGGHMTSIIYQITGNGQVIGRAYPPLIGDFLDYPGGSISVTQEGTSGVFDVFTEGLAFSDSVWYRIDGRSANTVLQGTAVQGTSVVLGASVTKPATPAAPTLLAADDSGAAGDGITNVRQPRLTGKVAAGVTVQLLNATGGVIATTQAGSDGTYVLSFTSPLADGTYPVMVQVVDQGAVSQASTIFNLVIDATAPTAPAAPGLLSADDTGVVGDGITSVSQPRLTGTATGGTSVQIVNGAGTVLGSGTIGAGGVYTVSLSAPLADGTYSLMTRVIDVAGNVSVSGSAFSLTIKTQKPSAPSAPGLLAADDTGVVGDGITSVSQPRLTGTATGGTSVQIVNGAGTVLGSGTIGAGGVYTVSLSAPLADGTYSLMTRVIDVAGNVSVSGSAFSLTIKTQGPGAPGAPALLAADDSGVAGDNITNVTRPRLMGIGGANATIQLLDNGGNLVATTTADAGGLFQFTIPSTLADGTYSYYTRTRDAAGNLSGLSSPLTLTILATPPPAPSTPALLATDMTPLIAITTTVSQPHLVGTARAGTQLALLDLLGDVIGTTTVNPDGSYEIQPTTPLADGNYTFQVQATDVAGNVSPRSGSLSLTISHTTSNPLPTPAAPVLLAADDSGTVGDNITKVTQPRLVGNVTAGTMVQLVDTSGNVLGTAYVRVGGDYQVTFANPLTDGVYNVSVRLVDGQGNVSASSPTLTLTIRTTLPATPTSPTLMPADDSGVVGDNVTRVTQPRFTSVATPNTTVQLLDSSWTAIASTVAGADGTYTLKPPTPLADGTYTFYVRTLDIAGNGSLASAPVHVTIKTVGGAAPSTPTLVAADDSGTVGDGITKVRQPRLTGYATAGAMLQLLNASGNIVGTTTVAADGSYTVQPWSSLNDGTYAFRVIVIDNVGNPSAASGSLSVTIQGATPITPGAPTLIPAIATGGYGSTYVTTVRRPTLTGTVQPADYVDLVDATGNVITSTQASVSSGLYTIQPNSNLGLGEVSLRVRVRDVAGNVSAFGPAVTVTILGTSTTDFNGDGKADLGVYRVSTSQWIVSNSTSGDVTTSSYSAVAKGDIPVPGDYDGSGRTQMAIFRPSTGQWFVLTPTGSRQIVNPRQPDGSFGATNLFDIPVPGDYDGVGYTEPAVFRPSTGQWFVLGPNGPHQIVNPRAVNGAFGATNLFDIPVPGDYDGVGHAEPAVFRPSTGQWFVLGPNGPHQIVNSRVANGAFGATSLFDIPVPGDYDGVGHAEPAVFRPLTGQWFVLGPNGPHQITNVSSPVGGSWLMSLNDVPLEAPIGALVRWGRVPIATVSATPAIAKSSTPEAVVASPTLALGDATTSQSSTSAPLFTTQQPVPAGPVTLFRSLSRK